LWTWKKKKDRRGREKRRELEERRQTKAKK
jgi:hypothetical protein